MPTTAPDSRQSYSAAVYAACRAHPQKPPPRFTIRRESRKRMKMRILIAYATRYGATLGESPQRFTTTIWRHHCSQRRKHPIRPATMLS
jgi:hypothetical protein